jgi:2-succinyl-5-enolpyruvyl-6-hydroxy-3-cyclohexene-1-carboxylate synthase
VRCQGWGAVVRGGYGGGTIRAVNPSTALATVLVDELVRQGVRHAVLCPGSRSAPLAYALQLADRAGRLILHVRVDERSAGFLALGLAKLTRVPAVVVTTSGTAVANLHPAVLEAHHGVVPLVVLSADRPVELRGTGANQTTTQPGMYAGAVRWSCDLAAPVCEGGEVDRWRAAVRDAMDHAQGTTQDVAEPGPVHLNVQLREPLVPTDGAAWPQDLTAVPTADADAPEHPAGPPAMHPDEAAGGDVAADDGDVAAEPRTLVVVGDLPDPRQFRQVLTWARSHGWPVVAEPFGTHPRAGVTPHAPLVLSSQAWLDAHGPARVVTVGRVTLSRPVAAILRRPGVRLEVVRTHRWIESAPTVAKVWEPEVLGRLGDHDGATGEDGTTWAAAWEAAGRAVGAALSVDLSTTGSAADDDGRALRSTDVAEVLWGELPPGATLFVGSSNTVRDLDLTSGGRGPALTVAANRGLAGIDGCVSTAVGVALAGEGPTYAWMGDLTFLHDANGLLLGPLEPRPDLTIVVTNDDGGGIFTLLEPGEPERAADFERIFGTPTGTDLRALCTAHGVVHHRVTTGQELAAAVSRRPRGVTVVEVPVEREQHRRSHAAMRRVARAVLG